MRSKDSMVEPQRKEHEHFELRAIHVVNVFPVRYLQNSPHGAEHVHSYLLYQRTEHALAYIPRSTSLS